MRIQEPLKRSTNCKIDPSRARGRVAETQSTLDFLPVKFFRSLFLATVLVAASAGAANWPDFRVFSVRLDAR